MAKRPHCAKASQPNSGHTSPAGYGKPPVHAQFKPGRSGNPKGRPKGLRNIRSVIEEALNQRITIREGDRTRSLTKLDGVILTMITGALKGNPKALGSLIMVMRSLGMTGEPPAANDQKPFTADDESLIADFLRRRGSESQPLTASEGKEEDKAEAKDAPPSHRSTKS